MAISPTVRQFQTGTGNTVLSEEESFKKKFSESAYTSFNAKYNSVSAYIITFKILEVSTEENRGIGTFILRYGADVRYVPVVMSDGKITSCEMLYEKKEDSFLPLTQKVLDSLKSANLAREHTVVDNPGKLVTEDTRDLFKNFFKPPVSSNPVLAGAAGLETLPNYGKEIISTYLKDNPYVLKKIASFYKVDILAEKLASIPEMPKVTTDIPQVISIDSLTKETARSLNSEEKRGLLDKGYLVTKDSEDKHNTLSVNKIAMEMVNKLHASEYTIGNHDSTNSVSGDIVSFDGRTGLKTTHCVIVGSTLITKDTSSYLSYNSTIVLLNMRQGVTAHDLELLGAEEVEYIKEPDDTKQLFIFTPTKSGRFRVASSDTKYFRSFYIEKNSKRNTDGAWSIHSSAGSSIYFSKELSFGSVNYAEELIVPDKSLCLVATEKSISKVTTMQELYKLIVGLGSRSSLVKDGAGITYIDKGANKTASFNNEASLVSYLLEEGFSKKAAEQLLKDKDIIRFSKEAFTQPAVKEETQISSDVPNVLRPYEYQKKEPTFDPEVINAAAEVGDPDIMDVGMLASVAGDSDIKVLLTDMIPSFEKTTAELGKVILTFVLYKKKIEGFYSREEYLKLLSNCRKIFVSIGDLLFDLKKYIHMN